MPDAFQTLIQDVGRSIGQLVQERLIDDLAHTSNRLREGVRESPRRTSPIAPRRSEAASEDKPEERDARGMLDKLIASKEAAKKSGKSMLEEFLERTESPRERKERIELDVVIRQHASPQGLGIGDSRREQHHMDRAMERHDKISDWQPGQEKIESKPFSVSFQKSPVPVAPRLEAPEKPREYVGEITRAVDRYTAKFFNNLGFGKIAHDPDDDEQVKSVVHQKTMPSPSQGAAGTPSSAPPSSRSELREPAASSGLIGRLISSFANWRMNSDRMHFGPQFFKPGFGKSRGPKRSAAVRSARLRSIAKARSTMASRDEKAIESTIGTAQYDPAKHKEATAASAAAQERLGQATALEAQATNAGAAASTRLATAIEGMSAGAVRLGGLLTPVTAAVSAGAATWGLMKGYYNALNSRVAELSQGGDYRGERAAIATNYARVSDFLQARQTEDTAVSAQRLTSETNRLRERLQPASAMLENIKNNVLAAPAMATNWVVDRVLDQQRRADAISQLQDADPNFKRDWLGRFDANEEARIKKRVGEIETEESKMKAEKDKETEQSFSQNIKGWVDAINWKKEARRNAKPRKPLPRI